MTDPEIEHTHIDPWVRKRGRPVGTTRKTPEELTQNQRAASSKWYYNNHEYRCTQKNIYYGENRDRILEQRKKKEMQTHGYNAPGNTYFVFTI